MQDAIFQPVLWSYRVKPRLCRLKDGKKLVFASTRDGREPRELNIFIADWVP